MYRLVLGKEKITYRLVIWVLLEVLHGGILRGG
jgi:hypothetical protein